MNGFIFSKMPDKKVVKIVILALITIMALLEIITGINELSNSPANAQSGLEQTELVD